jgi:hypothetical protein
MKDQTEGERQTKNADNLQKKFFWQCTNAQPAKLVLQLDNLVY